MGGRLNFMNEHECVISSLLEDLQILEKHVASGGRLDERDVRYLRDLQARLAQVLEPCGGKAATDPKMYDIPRPHWLQPLKRQDEKKVDEQYAARKSG